MISKKFICQILNLSLIFLPLAAQSNQYSADEAIRFNKSFETKRNPAVNNGISWKKREIKYDMNDKMLSKEKLMSTIWRLESNTNWMLLFYSDDSFVIGWGDIVAFGKY